MLLMSVVVFIPEMRWLKKRCFAFSNAERAAALAWALSVREPPPRLELVMFVASSAAVRLLWITSKATA